MVEMCQRLTRDSAHTTQSSTTRYNSLSLLDAVLQPVDDVTSCAPSHDVTDDFEVNVVDDG